MKDINQFLLSEKEVKTLYLALESYSDADYKPDAKMILSKAEHQKWPIANVYDDHFLLELEDSDVELLLKIYSRVFIPDFQSIATLLIKRSLKRGKLARKK